MSCPVCVQRKAAQWPPGRGCLDVLGSVASPSPPSPSSPRGRPEAPVPPAPQQMGLGCGARGLPDGCGWGQEPQHPRGSLRGRLPPQLGYRGLGSRGPASPSWACGQHLVSAPGSSTLRLPEEHGLPPPRCGLTRASRRAESGVDHGGRDSGAGPGAAGQGQPWVAVAVGRCGSGSRFVFGQWWHDPPSLGDLTRSAPRPQRWPRPGDGPRVCLPGLPRTGLCTLEPEPGGALGVRAPAVALWGPVDRPGGECGGSGGPGRGL